MPAFNIRLAASLSEPEKAEAVILPIGGSAETVRSALAECAAWAGVSADTLSADFHAKEGESLSLYAPAGKAPDRLHLLGVGDSPSPAAFLGAFRKFCYGCRSKAPKTIGLDLTERSFLKEAASDSIADYVEAAAIGWQLALYDLGLYKSEKEALTLEHLLVSVPPEARLDCERALAKGIVVGEARSSAMRLVDEPANHLTPEKLAEAVQASGEENGFEVTVLHRDELEVRGFGGVLAVGRGSANPPTVIVMEYKPDAEGLPKIGLVGKGITFDTGGVSIKAAENMHLMKSDMGGAAAVIGAVEAAARLRLPVHVIGCVASAENKTGSDAYLPSEVIKTYSGKTVEVLDTDAEGRIVMADAICYLNRTFQPGTLINVATLTGASVISLGYEAGALMTNNDGLAAQLLAVGESARERVWRLPIWKEYFKQLESDVADLTNLGGRPAGAITAAKFVEFFTEGHPNWAHLDIAGMALQASPYTKTRSGTGFGVRLLVEFMARLAETGND